MILRAFLTIAVVAVLAAGPAHADVFRCGKAFITFEALSDTYKDYEGITVRKSDIVRVFGPKRTENIPAFMTVKPNTSDGQPLLFFIDRVTHARIVECLD
ncbi:MAG: hypothetical protein OXF79_22490 [Chloroflexi bacterium]|nr:hypothetical protein [Chloroflexota bacterium]